MGKKIVLTGTTFTDAALPKLPAIDPIESAGSLLLIDPTHPAGAWPAGVPAHQSTRPNLFAANAAALVAADASAVRPAVMNRFPDMAAGTYALERTTKGAMHAILTEGAVAAQNAFGLSIPAPIKAYMKANVGHRYYYSMWTRITRPALTSASQRTFSVLSVNASFAHAFTQNVSYLGAPTVVVEGSTPMDNTGGMKRFSVASTPDPAFASGTDTDTAEVFANSSAWRIGARGGAAVAGYSSQALYRFYLEDLTVSGRTYAAVDAIDSALYNEVVVAAGGRYNGDTIPTAPSTIA